MYMHQRDEPVRFVITRRKVLVSRQLVCLPLPSVLDLQSYKSHKSNSAKISSSSSRRRNQIWKFAAILCYFRVTQLLDLVKTADGNALIHNRFCGR